MPTQIESLRVLLVDDNALGGIWRHRDHWRRNGAGRIGAEAMTRLSLADAGPPFDVLYDWRMLNSMEWTAAIRDSSLASVPTIIIVTAFGEKSQRKPKLAAFNGYPRRAINQIFPDDCAT